MIPGGGLLARSEERPDQNEAGEHEREAAETDGDRDAPAPHSFCSRVVLRGSNGVRVVRTRRRKQ